MRRTAVLGVITAFVLMVSGVDIPNVLSLSSPDLRPAVDLGGLKALRRLSLAQPAVGRSARREFALRLAGVRVAALPLGARPVVLGIAGRLGPSVSPAVPAVARPTAFRRLASSATTTGTHTIQGGDTLWAVARRYGVSVERLAAANGLRATAVLRLGRTLVIPGEAALGHASADTRASSAQAKGGLSPKPAASRRPASEATVTHVVRQGETLWEIARHYGTRVEDLASANDLGDSDWIKPGQRIVISGASLPRHRQAAARLQDRGPVMADVRARSAVAFLWPSRGVITSRFGWRYRRHHNGVDIAAPTGTPIYAAREGIVDYAGWKAGYGRLVRLMHEGGVSTLYGHASSTLVQVGQRVKKGQLIARVGCTGSCTGSHVHFEVRVDGTAVNPLRYLR